MALELLVFRLYNDDKTKTTQESYMFNDALYLNPTYSQILKTGPEVIDHCSCSSQWSMDFILLINAKMPTIVDILTFICRIKLFSIGNKARKLNKICSSNLYPFSPKSIMEHILATANESRLGDKV